MKPFLLLITSAGIALGAWQRHTLVGLRAETARVASELQNAETSPDTPPASEPESPAPDTAVVTDTELTGFISSMLAAKDGFDTDIGIRIVGGGPPPHPELCETLSRLNTAQIRAVIDVWPEKLASGEDPPLGRHRFLQLAGRVNPAATVPLLYEFLKEPNGMHVDDWLVERALQSWLRHDPEGLLRWAQQAGMPEGFKGQCATWTDAALVVRDPSAENVKKLLTHKTVLRSPFPEVALKLQTPEARLTFLQSLHDATGGIYDELGNIVTILADRTPFAQLAYLADATPAFQPSKEQRSEFGFTGRPRDQLGSLRLEVAADSRDGTAAQRWEWLTRRPEDHPSDKLFGRLVDAWCKNDYGDTAAWIRSLPPGSDRETATKKVIAFLEYNGGGDRLSEWKSQ